MLLFISSHNQTTNTFISKAKGGTTLSCILLHETFKIKRYVLVCYEIVKIIKFENIPNIFWTYFRIEL
jgi:hypothetical protein